MWLLKTLCKCIATRRQSLRSSELSDVFQCHMDSECTIVWMWTNGKDKVYIHAWIVETTYTTQYMQSLTAQNQVITIPNWSDNNPCLCGKLRIKHAQASDSKGEAKVNLSPLTAVNLLNRIKLCKVIFFLHKAMLLYIKSGSVWWLMALGLMQNFRKNYSLVILTASKPGALHCLWSFT